MSVKDRLIQFIDHLNEGGQTWFEDRAGLSRGYVSNLKGGISSRSLNKIKQAFPEINTSWLASGEGDMLTGSDQSSLTNPKTNIIVPFYQDVVLTGGAVEVYNGNRQGAPISINLGGAFADATGAMQVSGHSMYPNYESGCIVGYREVHDKSYFAFGEAYIIGTADYQLLKRVQKSDKPGWILLTSDNDEPGCHGKPKYEQFEIEIDKIRFMAIVLGKIIRTQMKLMQY